MLRPLPANKRLEHPPNSRQFLRAQVVLHRIPEERSLGLVIKYWIRHIAAKIANMLAAWGALRNMIHERRQLELNGQLNGIIVNTIAIDSQ
jgi:hypothetical protein